jgi:hypothetical protein
LADKPGSVLGNHSSRPAITHWLQQHTRPQARAAPYGILFGLAPGGVYLATHCCQRCGALLPHPFTLTGTFDESKTLRRSPLCCTCRRLAPPRHYLAPCPMEPGLSSPCKSTSTKQAAIAWPTPGGDSTHINKQIQSASLTIEQRIDILDPIGLTRACWQ